MKQGLYKKHVLLHSTRTNSDEVFQKKVDILYCKADVEKAGMHGHNIIMQSITLGLICQNFILLGAACILTWDQTFCLTCNGPQAAEMCICKKLV